MTNLQTLETEIANVERELGIAEQENATAGAALALAPSDPDKLKAARTAAGNVAAIRADLELLRDAKIAAQAADTAEAAAAARAKAIAHLEAVENMQLERMKVAAKIDKILDALKVACADWKSVCTEMHTEAHAFFKTTTWGRGGHEHQVVVTASEITGAIAAELDTATHGMNDHHVLQFSYLRQKAGQPELATDAAQCMGRVLLTRMREVAKQKGLIDG